MKASKNDLGGNKPIVIAAVFVFALAIFSMINTELNFVDIPYPEFSTDINFSEIFWGVGLTLFGTVLLIIGLAKK